ARDDARHLGDGGARARGRLSRAARVSSRALPGPATGQLHLAGLRRWPASLHRGVARALRVADPPARASAAPDDRAPPRPAEASAPDASDARAVGWRARGPARQPRPRVSSPAMTSRWISE